jgi:hypothetical protein
VEILAVEAKNGYRLRRLSDATSPCKSATTSASCGSGTATSGSCGSGTAATSYWCK